MNLCVGECMHLCSGVCEPVYMCVCADECMYLCAGVCAQGTGPRKPDRTPGDTRFLPLSSSGQSPVSVSPLPGSVSQRLQVPPVSAS